MTLSRSQVREVDRVAIEQFGIPGIVLMENAGRAITDRICELNLAGPVVIMCGAGNNGGDGHVVARHLDLRGYDVTTVNAVPSSKLTGDAAANYQINERLGLREVTYSGLESNEADIVQLCDSAVLIVDALLGTGATGAPRAHFARLIEIANAASAKRLAIDIPSGLDCDTGEPSTPTFRPDFTTTLVARKTGFCSEAAKEFLGEVTIHDIGFKLPTPN
ncbi:MAG: NAD(P)H-hydrate epimerase [Planctomycetales bacterium]|nr:NAD(P)H-hydrate epimerase [Planctomycetales bacterium]